MSVDKLKRVLGIRGDERRVMTVTERLGNGRVRVEDLQGRLDVPVDYPLDTQLIISGGNVVGVVGQSAGTFYI